LGLSLTALSTGLSSPELRTLSRVIDIRRAAQLMLKRYGDKALVESATPADERRQR
jgi:hypothetical protein